jgi:hypothetical protein
MIVPKPDRDDIYRAELLKIMQLEIDKHPRSHQAQIGPSEIGGCETKVAWKLAHGGDGDREGGWAAHRGTLIHNWLDLTFKGADRFMPDGGQRFFSDMRLDAVSPHVNGGTLDLYDLLYQTVVDWKCPGEWSVRNIRSGKISEGYYIQTQVYGLGLERMGYPVSRVSLAVLPACGDDLHTMAKGAILLCWPYDPQVALDALANVDRIQNLIDVAGPAKVLEVLPKRSDFCAGCPAFVGSKDRRATCPGVTAKPMRQESSNPFS